MPMSFQRTYALHNAVNKLIKEGASLREETNTTAGHDYMTTDFMLLMRGRNQDGQALASDPHGVP